MSSKALRPSIVQPLAASVGQAPDGWGKQEMTRVGARWRLPGSRERMTLLAGHVKFPPLGSPKSSAASSGRTWDRSGGRASAALPAPPDTTGIWREEQDFFERALREPPGTSGFSVILVRHGSGMAAEGVRRACRLRRTPYWPRRCKANVRSRDRSCCASTYASTQATRCGRLCLSSWPLTASRFLLTIDWYPYFVQTPVQRASSAKGRVISLAVVRGHRSHQCS
jgi:hypothetical protein